MTKSLWAEFDAIVGGRSDLVIAQGFYCRVPNDCQLRPVAGGCLIWLASSGKDLTRAGDRFLHDGLPISLDPETAHLLCAYHDYFIGDSHGCKGWLGRLNALFMQVNLQLARFLKPSL